MRNKFYFLIVVLYSISLNLKGQHIEDFQIPTIIWSKWDVHHKDLKAKESFLAGLYENGKPIEIDSLIYFKVVNIDGQNDLDVIYHKGPDSTGFVIYLNEQSKLVRIYEDSVTLVEVSQVSPISPLSFKTIDKNNGQLEVNYLESSIKEGKISYNINRIDIIAEGTKDVYRNMPPTYFRIKNSGTPLVQGPGLHILVKTYSQSDVGYAMGSVKTKSGDVWWKVFILESDYKFRMGWLKRTDVLTGYQK